MITIRRSRRQFLALASAGVALPLCACDRPAAAPLVQAASSDPPRVAPGPVPRRALGKTGAQVSILGVGGWHLGATDRPETAIEIVHRALDAGINFFDNAWEYHDGKSEEVLGRALQGRRDEAFLMTKVCTHGRGADVAMSQLEDSLRRLGTDHLDLWQVHECIYDNDPERTFEPDGVWVALERAKKEGKTRFVGFTGHKDPAIHLRILAHGFPFDTVQMPLNCFDATFRSFETQVLPEVVRRGMAPIGMKSLTGAGDPVRRGAVTVDEALRYAMSVPGVALTVTGIDTLDVLAQNLAIARGFTPMAPPQRQALRDRVRPLAADGRFELFKSTTRFDAKIGREEHGYPPEEQLPL